MFPPPPPHAMELYLPSSPVPGYPPSPSQVSPTSYSPRRFFDPLMGMHPLAPVDVQQDHTTNAPIYNFDMHGPASTRYGCDRVSYPPVSTSGPFSSDGDPQEVAKKNQLDLERIETGLDTRTTVMIKNIPNKMSDKDLLNFIERVCPRKIDFMYLRMDFQNGELLIAVLCVRLGC